MNNRQSGFKLMKRLIKVLKPLTPIMMITISFGVLGFLSAIAITSFGMIATATALNIDMGVSIKTCITIIITCGILRGVLRYIEQYSGHFIAFTILAILRDQVFKALRRLSPAKLESKEKGNLISVITSDIELLEVFYAHTIAPISIAVITNSIITIILFLINPIFGVIAAIFYIIVGFVIPYASSSFAKESGVEYRNIFGESNNYVLDSLRGLKEVLLYKNGEERLNKINENSKRLNKSLDKIKDHEGIIRATTDITIMIAILTFVVLGASKFLAGEISFTVAIVVIVIIASSFGPVVALSNLSNTLLQTFACAERIFELLDENPQVEEVSGKNDIRCEDIVYNNVTFSYPNRKEKIFENASLNIKKGEKIALIGESGIGKSTFIKLIMRFWDVNSGDIKLDNINIKEVNTKSLRNAQRLVSQETYLFNESIMENIKIGNKNATEEEVIEAAKKASIHDFILTLPNGYDTKVGELGGNLSSGEKQRIGLARAFLKDSEVLILDEPTSNLDALNEGEILKSINENCKDKTIILISHRKSTTAICDKVYKLENKKVLKFS